MCARLARSLGDAAHLSWSPDPTSVAVPARGDVDGVCHISGSLAPVPSDASAGHEEQLPPPRLSGCDRFGQPTFTGACANDEDAPTPVIPVRAIKRRLTPPSARRFSERMRRSSRDGAALLNVLWAARIARRSCSVLYAHAQLRWVQAIRILLSRVRPTYLRSELAHVQLRERRHFDDPDNAVWTDAQPQPGIWSRVMTLAAL